MALEIIGAGFGRTGTMSLKHALERLGYGPCYHMIELTNQPEKVSFWEDLARGRTVDYTAMFSKYQSICDFPGCLFYRELLQAYPQAKVILTVRDPEDWYRSAAKTIFKTYPTLPQFLHIVRNYFFSKRTRQLMRLGWLIQRLIYGRTFGYRQGNKEKAIAAYLQHNKDVRKRVPADRLLVYRVSEGWQPLCDFLGVEPPDEPFPRTNRADHFHRMKNLSLRAKVPEHIKKL